MGTTTALIAFSSGAGAAYAAPGESSNASGQFLSGSLFTAPLSGVVDLGAASASNNGTQETIVDRDDIDLTALGLVNVQLPGGLQLPLNVADAGVLGQYAAANPDGSSVGASGAIGADGQVGVGPTGGSGDLTFDLGGLTGGLGLSPALLAEVSDLNLTVGAVSARASQAAPDAAVGTYTIADADLAFQSDTLASLIGLVDGTVTSLEAQLGGLGTQLEAELLDIPGLGFVVDANLSVDVPSLADAVSDILTQELSSGGVAIDLTTGVVTVDLAVLNDLNNLPPSTNLLGASQLSAITTNITALIDGLVDDLGAALQDVVNGVAVTGNVTALGIPVVTIDTTIGGLLANSSAGLAVIGLPIPVGTVLTALLGPITAAGLGDIVGLLSPVVLDPVINLVVPAISPVLNAAVGLTANVQNTSGGVFTETALRVTVLPAGPALVANLATATVGPNVALADPSITTIDPDEGLETGGTTVTLTGTDFSGVTSVTIGGTVVTDLTVTPTTIVFVTPPHVAEIVDVVANAPQGDSAPVAFEYLAVPASSISLDPTEGTEAGGTSVTVTGTGFVGATGVEFDGLPGVDFVVVNDTTITVTTAAHAPGVVGVIVVDPAGNSAPLDYEYLAVPSAALSLDPTSGSVAGGTPVTITGSGFVGATAVEFDGIAGTDFTVVNDSTITVTSPAHDAGLVEVVVLDPAGDSDPLDFTYAEQPAIAASLDPTEGTELGGTVVTITGSGFLGATGVEFDGIAGTDFVIVDDSTITVSTPAHGPGPVGVVVIDPAGNSDALLYTYLTEPSTVTSLDPVEGTEAGGTEVTITGSGFTGATEVTFDGIAGTGFQVVDDSTIVVTSPAHAPGPVDVVVIDGGGNSAPLAYTYLAEASAAIDLTPEEGSESGGTAVTVTGSGFTGATGVTFDGIPGTEFQVVDDSTITVISPAHAPGVVDVVVVDPAGNSAPVDFEFVADASNAQALDPSSGPVVGGTPVTITGSGFVGATAVEFDGIPGTNFTVVDDSTITVTSPAHDAGLVDVIVLDPAGNSGALDYTYVEQPAIAASLDPTEGTELGGTAVTITGSGFLGATGVEFDEIAGTNFVIVDDSTITVTTPAHAPGSVNVVVIDPAGNSDALIYGYLAEPSIAETLDPSEGPENGGTTVTITGSGFTGATGVTFDGIAGTEFLVVDDSTITVTSPAHAPGVVEVIVVDAAGGSSVPLEFTYLAEAADVVSLDPTSGSETGGTTVTITGSGFTGATGVTFDGVPGTEFQVVDDSTITVISPAHAPGVVDVVVVDPAGNSAPVDFTYLDERFDVLYPPVVGSLDPSEGPETGGTTVTITGSGFTGATGVTFDGVVGTDFVIVDDSTITVTSPAHAPGAVDVIVVDPAGDSAPVDFVYIPVADIEVIDPSTGPEAGGTTVTIVGTCFTGATAVLFGDVTVTDFEVSADGTTITVISPAGAGSVGVTVVGAAECGTATEEDGFSYEESPSVVDSITPDRGPQTGGTVVTIGGSGFTGSTGANFGGVPGTDFTVVDDNTITVVAPVSNPGIVPVVVTDPAGNSAPISFEFFAVAEIDAVTPGSGAANGGTTVRISGQCFTGATAVWFGDTKATSFSVNSAGTLVTAVSPAGTGTVDVTVVGAGDCGSATSADAFAYNAPGLANTGVSATGALLAGFLLLMAGTAALLSRRGATRNN